MIIIIFFLPLDRDLSSQEHNGIERGMKLDNIFSFHDPNYFYLEEENKK